LEFWLNVNF